MAKIAKRIIFLVVVFILADLLKQFTISQILGVDDGSTNKMFFYYYLMVLHLLVAYCLLSPVYKKLTQTKDSNVNNSTLTAAE